MGLLLYLQGIFSMLTTIAVWRQVHLDRRGYVTERCAMCFAGLLLPLALAMTSTDAVADQHDFISDGAAKNIHYVGKPWVSQENSLQSVGDQSRLFAGEALAAGDFHITTRLTLPKRDHRGALLGIGPFSQIAFDDNGGRAIVRGPLFVPSDQMIQYTILGSTKDRIQPGVSFVLEVIRQGNEATILINGEPFATLPMLRSHNGPIALHPGTQGEALWVHDLSVQGQFEPYEPGHFTAAGAWIHPKVRWTPDMPIGTITRLNDGGILKISGNDVRVSHDAGKTWDKWLLRIRSDSGVSTSSAVPFCAADGTLIAAFINPRTVERFNWDDKLGTATTGRRDVWVMRSVDGGKTWIDAQLLMKGYCGAMSSMIQTASGSIILPVQEFMFAHGRHATRTHVSMDSGKTWKAGNLLDVGGEGNHDGAFEPTIVERPDGRTWMLIRTNLDYLWSAYSDQDGRNWRHTEPSQFEASSSPGAILRLNDGRMVLVWNPVSPVGRDSYPRRVGKWSDSACSWCREEVWIAFSDKDGERWTDPLVIARRPGSPMAYFSLFEYEPGNLWIKSGGIGLRVSVDVDELLEDMAFPEKPHTAPVSSRD